MHFAEKLLHLRKREGLSQEELAAELGVSRQAVSRWEMGSAIPDAPNLLHISKRFGVTVDSLLDEGSPEIPATAGAGQKQRAVVLLLIGLQALACLCGLAGWLTQSERTVWIGLALNLAGIVAFEAGFFGFSGAQTVQGSRRTFYRASVWLFAYSPVRMAVTFLWKLYPRPYPALLAWGSILAVYLVVCAFTFLRLSKTLPPVNRAEG